MKRITLTLKELSERWGVNEGVIRDLVNAGKLNRFPNLTRYLFLKDYIEEYERECFDSNLDLDATIPLSTKREINRLKRELAKKDEHIRKINNLIRQAQIELCEYEIDINE